jgi:hypothetical protein
MAILAVGILLTAPIDPRSQHAPAPDFGDGSALLVAES